VLSDVLYIIRQGFAFKGGLEKNNSKHTMEWNKNN
jgi:hypothetical protein